MGWDENGRERTGNGTGTGRERDGNGTGTGRERDGNGEKRPNLDTLPYLVDIMNNLTIDMKMKQMLSYPSLNLRPLII